MKVFLTGASGYIGTAVAEALLAAGHTVTGLARSVEAEQTLKGRGITPVRGDLNAAPSLVSPVKAADGVIHTGTTNNGRNDIDAVRAMLDALTGTNKPLVYTSGIWVLGNTGDTPATESSALHPPPIVAWRPALESDVLNAEGVRGIVIRPAIVYGRGAGLPSLFVQSATESGAARYIGTGENRWPLVEVDDLAELYVKAFEKAGAGSLWHAVHGESVPMKTIAEAASFGADAGGLTESMPVEQANARFGEPLVQALLLDQVVSGEKAKRDLGWTPDAISILEDLRYGSYAMTRINP